ncbi:MAG: hypothetical protein A2142_06070, partial [candidate division Zixibacteria bacterium RBG_16_48_11]
MTKARFLTIVCLSLAVVSSISLADQSISPGSVQFQLALFISQESESQLSISNTQEIFQDEFKDEFVPTANLKSPKRAFLLSLLLPGAGQYYNESKTKAGIFAGAEASIWAGFAAFRLAGGWKKEDYQNYAVDHAGIIPDGKDDDFYERLTYYDDRDQYNQFTRLYNGPESPVYPETDYWNWIWDSNDSRSKYRDLRNQSKNAFRRSVYMVGLAALNRVVSALDAFRGAKKYNSKKVFE